MAQGYIPIPVQGVSTIPYTTPTVYENRVTIVSGGIISVGKFGYINIILKANTTLTNSPTVLYALGSGTDPQPLMAIQGNDNPNFGEMTSVAAGTRSGNLYLDHITTNKYYFVSGWYKRG